MIHLSFVLPVGLLPSAWSVDCVFLDPFSKGSNFPDRQIIWHTHTQIRCLLCICLVSFYLLFLPSFGCPYFGNIWPILWGNMVLLIADACESWDSVPISAGELWEIFEKLPVCQVFPESSSDGWNSWVSVSADASVLLQIRRAFCKCASQSSQLCLCCWLVLEHGSCFSLDAAGQVLKGFRSWIPLQLIRHKSPGIGSLVHSTFPYRCSCWSITWQCWRVGSALSHCLLCWEGDVLSQSWAEGTAGHLCQDRDRQHLCVGEDSLFLQSRAFREVQNIE